MREYQLLPSGRHAVTLTDSSRRGWPAGSGGREEGGRWSCWNQKVVLSVGRLGLGEFAEESCHVSLT